MNSVKRQLKLVFFVVSILYLNMGQVVAQQVQTTCGASFDNQLPVNFRGAVYYIVEPLINELPTTIRRVSISGQAEYTIPLSLQSTILNRRPLLSPDGQYIVVRPTTQDRTLVVWSLVDGSLRTLLLDDATSSALTGANLTRSQFYEASFNELLTWYDNNTLAISSYNTSNGLAVESEQLVEVTQSGLSFSAPVIVSNLPISISAVPEPIVSLVEATSSSNELTAIAGNTVSGTRVLTVLDIQNNPVYTDVETQERRPVDTPTWFGIGQYLLYREFIAGNGFQPVILDSQVGFSRDDTFYSLLDATFGYPTVDAGFPATVSSDGERVALMTAERYPDRPALPFLITYNPTIPQLTVNCIEAAEVNYSLGDSFWLSDDQLIGFRIIASGYLALFEPTTGNQFYFTSGHVVGVVE